MTRDHIYKHYLVLKETKDCYHVINGYGEYMEIKK